MASLSTPNPGPYPSSRRCSSPCADLATGLSLSVAVGEGRRMYRSLLKRMLGSRLGAALTVGLWLVVVSVLTVVAPDFKSVQDNSADSLPPAATESMRAHELM